MTHSEGSPERVWSLMQDIKVAMVVTHDGQGDRLRARPMAARPDRQANAVFFLTDANAGKDDEVERNSNVCLAFADIKGQKYVSVTGVAHVSNDRSKIRELWSVVDKAFWKNADDPAVRLMKVEPVVAEYWEGPGLVVSFVKMIGAALTGGERDFGDNKKVELSGSGEL
jgi:general stress protein 26